MSNVSRLYIVATDDTPTEIYDSIEKFLSLTSAAQADVDELQAAFHGAFSRGDDPVEVFETDAAVDDETRELILFGSAFESGWYMEDVYIACFHDGTNAWVSEH